jgi:ribosomal protein S18 acetylase RimI-like enzyme
VITQSKEYTIHSATIEDRQQLANLVHFGALIHRHLDWRAPLDWIGSKPFVCASNRGSIAAALASPPDPPGVAWIRLFAVSSGQASAALWELLWEDTRTQLREIFGSIRVAAIPLQSWFANLLAGSHFATDHSVVVLNWSERNPPDAAAKLPITLRPMVFDDIPAIEKIDYEAFGGVWQNSLASLELAFRQAALATVAELDGALVGYQISTATQVGGHLARLAVLPTYQGYGIGYLLTVDTLTQFARRGGRSVTVNTQNNNTTSLQLYKKAGFRLTGEEYPVYEYVLK